jgi:hypothetical protein
LGTFLYRLKKPETVMAQTLIRRKVLYSVNFRPYDATDFRLIGCHL